MNDFKLALEDLPDEAVEVNQRALIDKVLARYSGENTIFRELLQNADDASANSVQIKFLSSATSNNSNISTTNQPNSNVLQTNSSQVTSSSSPQLLPDLKTQKIHRIIVSNNGIPFRDQDWARLRKIAEGNPDESKIGAFGVGFYALWSICDSPIVLSGPSIMGFNWSTKNPDQLVTRRGINPTPSEWTTFVMDVRSASPIPPPFEFSRFLATSLAFTTQIRSISMFFDDHLMCKLEKKLAPPLTLSTVSNLVLTAPMNMMKIQSIEQTSVQIDANLLKWTFENSKPKLKSAIKNATASAVISTSSFASRMLSAFTKSSTSSPSSTPSSTPLETPSKSSDLLSELKASLFLRVVTANVNVSVPKAFSSELERATKKLPPKKTKYELIWTNKDEFDAGKDSNTSNSNRSKLLIGDENARAVFDGLISELDVQGRVFIGFPTHQTTGFSGSVAARFIPTVERESLDLQAKYVADWNRELLAIGGILARAVYEGEMKEIEGLWKQNQIESTQTWLTARALHAMQFFSFHASTPAGTVSSDTEESFFQCDRYHTLTVPSTLGPLSATKVRLPNPELAGFIKNVPVLPSQVLKDAHVLVAKLRDRRMILEITLEDVFKELENRVLSADEMRECLNWWISLTGIQGYDRSLMTRFLKCAIFKYQAPISGSEPASKESSESIMSLNEASTMINIKLIPTDVPLPAHCLPFCLTKSMNLDALKRVFGFRELTLLEFTTHLFSSDCKGQERITESPILAERLLNILTKAWSLLSHDQQAEVSAFLKDKVFIPTRHGMKKATDAYHSNVTLFQDLSVVCLPSGTPVKGTMEKVLTTIGVRKHVELQMVFSRLIGSGEWSHVDLVKYLVTVKDTLTDLEIDRLKHTSWLPKDGEPKVDPPPGPDGKPRKPKTKRYTANELYEPSPANQELKLPLVEWSAKWRSSSEEAKLLFFLGLNKLPGIDELLNIAANQDVGLREKALRFFLDHFADYRATYRPNSQTPAFVPCNTGLFRPQDAYSNPEAAVMGFHVLQAKYIIDYQKFGLQPNPSSNQLMKSLMKSPPPNRPKAKVVFDYLSTRVADFSQTELQTLRQTAFIPIIQKDTTHVSPAGCFFQPQDSLDSGPFRSLFTYIDFGLAARPFLLACGVKNEPTVQEITEMLIADPAKFYALAGSAEEYLQVLRNIAANVHLLGHGLKQAMQRSAFILGSRRLAPNANNTARIDTYEDDDDDLEAGHPFVHVLAVPKDVVIIDDSHSYSQFTTVIVACPQEEVFEHLAESLGASRLTRMVKESFRVERASEEQNERTEEMRRLLIERTALFLHERQTGARNDVIRDSEWLKRHLVVKLVDQVSLQRQLVYLGKTYSSTLKATATASMDGKNSMVLYLVRKTEIDWFELASSVCKLILANQKLSDSLFFMTILQTSLKNLKRRGVNVDRIINARKAEREAAQQRAREEKLQQQLDATNALTPEQLEGYAKKLEEQYPDADPGYIRKALTIEKEDHLNQVREKFAHGAYERRPIAKPMAPSLPDISQRQSGIFSSLRRKLLTSDEAQPSKPPPYSDASSSPLLPVPAPPQPIMDELRSKAPSVRPPVQATPMSDIRNNLLKAIQASKPDSNSKISNQIDTKPIKESGSSYCDPKGKREDLSFLTVTSSGVRFYVSRFAGNGELVLYEYGEALVRYSEKIILPIGALFDIDPNSLHIFYDLEGPIIAFNKSGSLFFNLRFYLAWYDEEVKVGNISNALIGTFSTFCHELAHNLVEEHNSEHEWWMSAFIEQYFLKVCNLIKDV